MSLTQAAALNDDGRLDGRLRDWSERSGKKRKTIFKAIEDLYAWRAFRLRRQLRFHLSANVALIDIAPEI
jgi:hypothetical protein